MSTTPASTTRTRVASDAGTRAPHRPRRDGLAFSARIDGLWDVVAPLGLTRFFDGTEPFACSVEVNGIAKIADVAPEPVPTRVITYDRAEHWLTIGADYTFTAHRRSDGSTTLVVTARTQARCDEVLTAVRARVPTAAPDDTVEVDIWFMEQRPRTIERRVTAPTWDAIDRNYAGAVQRSLAPLYDLVRPSGRGRILLWHGPPGTGKTTAARALSRAWAPWCRSVVVTEPERLFASAGLVFDVVGDRDDTAPDGGPSWTLLIVEDADELVRGDARAASGQALSRLLNLADGYLGQGLDVLVLISTNERLGGIHPAIARPGRCLSHVEFPRLSRAEATAWLGADPGAGTDHSLAELIAQRDGTALPTTESTPPPGQYL